MTNPTPFIQRYTTLVSSAYRDASTSDEPLPATVETTDSGLYEHATLLTDVKHETTDDQ